MYAAARELGIEVECVLAVDSWDKTVEVYNANMPHPVAVVADVKRMTRADLPPHDLVIGGPPCQPYSLAGKRKGADDPRDCLPDFLRLIDGSAWLMENVIPRLIPSVPFSVKLNAFDFGDVTTRKRWFYSDHLLHVIPTPGTRRFGDIRDHEADRIALLKRGAAPVVRKKGDTRGGRSDDGEKVSTYADADADAVASLTAHAWHGRDVRSNVKMVAVRGRKGNIEMTDDVAFGSFTGESNHRGGALIRADDAMGSFTQSSHHGHKNSGSGNLTERTLVAMRSYPQPYTIIGDGDGDGDGLGSVTSHTHDQPLRAAGQSRPTQDGDVLGSPTSGKGGSTGFLKVGLRGHSASASAFNDDEPIGSLIANSWHGNEISRLGPSVRCPSLLEMARAHSIPDTFEWCGATKTARGKMIANSWPIGMATAVCRAMLVAMDAR